MNPLKSVGGRLSIALLLVVAGALGITYLVVVPRLENRLLDTRYSQLGQTAGIVSSDAFSAQGQAGIVGVDWQGFVTGESRLRSVRVAMYQIVGPRTLRLLADSANWSNTLRDSVARAYMRGDDAPVRGIIRRGNQRIAEVAETSPVPGTFFLVSTPVEDTYDIVAVVERRLLFAGLIALVIALSVGFVAARLFARRIRRLERAADRIATGHFDQPVVDSGQDELGELAVAFERMRQRLAHLEHARREFIANASHELRTPLFALGGLLELLDDEELDEETRREFLGTAREQSDRLTKLATDLLDLSRLDAGRLHVERETVELEELAEALQGEFRAVAHASEHPLEVLGDTVAAVADEQRILQVGRVLVENALVHTPPGTTVRIATRLRDSRAVLAVEDDGPGIPHEHLAHVFERFYRVNGTVTSGSGLGLAIARELAELMGGTLEIDSQPGRTVFTLTLPPAALPSRTAVA
jgi:signal transduction histidine kinase